MKRGRKEGKGGIGLILSFVQVSSLLSRVELFHYSFLSRTLVLVDLKADNCSRMRSISVITFFSRGSTNPEKTIYFPCISLRASFFSAWNRVPGK